MKFFHDPHRFLGLLRPPHRPRIPRQKDFTVVGIAESHISADIKWLQESQIILNEGEYYRFNKDFDQWQISRVKPYEPQKLTELVRINLDGTYQNGKSTNNELTKTVSQNLPKQEVSTSQNSKFSTSKLASPKENIKENINKDIDNNSKYFKGKYGHMVRRK